MSQESSGRGGGRREASCLITLSAMGQREERGGISHDLKSQVYVGRDTSLPQYCVLRETGKRLPFLPAVCKSCGLAHGPVSICQIRDTHLLWPWGLAWEVLLCVRKAGLLPKVTAGQTPVLADSDTHALPVPYCTAAITHPGAGTHTLLGSP